MNTNRTVWAVVTAWLLCCGGVASAQYGGASMFGPPGSGTPGLLDPSFVTPVGAQMTLSDGGSSGSCTSGGCDACGECTDCCKCRCLHKYAAFGELLYLRQRGGEVPFAVNTNGPIANPAAGLPIYNPTSRFARVDPTERAGFRVGVSYYFDDCLSSITGSYTRFESMNANTLTAQPGNAIASLVTVPTTLNTQRFWLTSAASESIDFQFADIDFKTPFFWTDSLTISWVAGARYGNLKQDFRALNSFNGSEAIRSGVHFDGGGFKLGLDGTGDIGCSGLYGYGKSNMSLLGGVFRADYRHDDQFLGTLAQTGYRAARMTTIFETEAGLGWHTQNNGLRLSVGYMFNSWQNVMKVNEYINTVRTSNPTDPSDNFNGLISFDGLVARVEGRW